ncbi:MAG: phosphoribosylamine--glycine ligase [Desulfovibrionaceae bacterium]|nr:phosphoribosylamine--glycine ligase [Desulfovibrionaceae bacterium]
MRILVIGSGGREHALVWKLSQSPLVSEIIVAPGNGGMELEGVRNIPVKADDIAGLSRLAREEKVDLVVPGPELPLTEGIVDAMEILGIPCFGPDRYCAQMEGSKLFAKQIMEKSGVPTAACAAYNDPDSAKAFVRAKGAPLVIKADGLAAGKGVIVAQTVEEALEAIDSIMCQKAFGDAGRQVLIEEFLVGEEVSLLALCDGKHAVPLPSAQDHKAAYDGDTGPNTGGMGAYSPAPILPDSELEAMCDRVIRPILEQLDKEGHPFTGVLYAGLMMTAKGPKVLEYNVRFGDPECQPLLARLDSDLVEIILACLKGELSGDLVRFTPKSALGIVIAAAGYPGSYGKGMPIEGLKEAEEVADVKVFHSGTRLVNGQVQANGGRVLCVTALGNGLEEARSRAYEAAARISMPDSRYRSDIGIKGIERLAGKR